MNETRVIGKQIVGRESDGYFKLFSILADAKIQESTYTVGYNTETKEWTNVEWLDASPYDYKFLEAKTKLNKRDYPVLLIYFDDREEIIESTPLPTDDGEILEGYFMESYCFVEIDKK